MHSPETGNVTKIQYLMPGFQGDGAYGHDYWCVCRPSLCCPTTTSSARLVRRNDLTGREEIYILSGSGYCGTAKVWLKEGDYACRPPGMIHGPFTIPEDGPVCPLLGL